MLDKAPNLPFATTKKKLVEMYLNQMPEHQIKKGINEIINENRKIKSNCVQRIWHKEFSEFVATYGLPQGYV